MHPASLPLLSRWRYALKPASWPKLLVAAALGQAIGISASGRIDALALVLGLGFVVFDLAFIVLLNDWGDQEVDAIKRRIAGDLCSPKTIPDRILEPSSVLVGGLGAGALALAVAATAEEVLGRPGLTTAAVVCLGVFVAYTLPPLRLNYRGGGEVLEMLGVGFALPWLSAYLQGGVAVPRALVVLPAFALLCLASALASGLSDEASDRLGGKRTFTTRFGPAAVRHAAEGLVLGAILVWAALPILAADVVKAWMVAPVALIMAVDYRELQRQAARIQPEQDLTHAVYKRRLHDCIWRGALIMALLLIVSALFRGGIG